ADSGNRKIRRIDANGLIHTVISLDDEETAQTVASLSIALDAVEQLLFSNEIEHDFSALTLDNVVRPVAGRGEPGFAGDGGPAIEASLHAPGGSVSNVFSDIFLADTENHNVRLLWRKLGDPDAPCGQVVAIGFLPSVAISGEKLIGF